MHKIAVTCIWLFVQFNLIAQQTNHFNYLNIQAGINQTWFLNEPYTVYTPNKGFAFNLASNINKTQLYIAATVFNSFNDSLETFNSITTTLGIKHPFKLHQLITILPSIELGNYYTNETATTSNPKESEITMGFGLESQLQISHKLHFFIAGKINRVFYYHPLNYASIQLGIGFSFNTPKLIYKALQ